MALRRLVKTRSLLSPLLQLGDVGPAPAVRSVATLSTTTSRAVSLFFASPSVRAPNLVTLLEGVAQGCTLPRRLLTTTPSQADELKKDKKSIMVEEEEYDLPTDKIPEKPMTAAEGASYTAIILAAFAVLGMCLWGFVSTYVWDPVEYTCFNITLEKLRSDPRVTVRVGDVIKGYGSDSMNRRRRHIIPNRQYTDANGTEHTQIQFNIKGTGGVGVVYADMFRDEFKKWQYTYLYVDIPEHGRKPQRLAIVAPSI